ncbi:maleylpyruvate isomerase family mycothiol-dependent enzyme [Ferrimicrobium sp.]|uniref:Maleylpyruvate isomerase family mycothiol-dependent enzyme n=2 Tax=Acidimicrobiaceae TaxID=84994 RepID=A0ABV3Y5D6_9ACTN|nr:maleylpyruvate isomerase family mycothiol-dependent enzyme [Ferrimicrobium sp.]
MMNADNLRKIDEIMVKIEDRSRRLNASDPIATCPDWSVTDLTEHLAMVTSRMRIRIETNSDPDPTTIASSAPLGMDSSSWLARSYLELRNTLLAHDLDDPAWNWTGKNETVGWYVRRLTHELAIHLVDFETASPSPAPPSSLGIDTPLAADGIDELLTVFLPTRAKPKDPTFGRHVLVLDPSDSVRTPWTLELSGDTIALVESSSRVDARVEGTSLELYLFGWNRPTENLNISGSMELIRFFQDLPR